MRLLPCMVVPIDFFVSDFFHWVHIFLTDPNPVKKSDLIGNNTNFSNREHRLTIAPSSRQEVSRKVQNEPDEMFWILKGMVTCSRAGCSDVKRTAKRTEM